MGGSNAVRSLAPMMKIAGLGGLGLLLAACAPRVPESSAGAGVGFGEYSQYGQQREAQLSSGGSFGAPPPVSAAPIGAMPVGGNPSTDLAAAGIGSAPMAAPMGAPMGGMDSDRRGGVQASPGNAAPVLAGANPATISDEQDFDAVAGRESIQSDAERRAEQAAAYQVIQPTALPQRAGDGGPNIVEYALSAPNVRGQEWYSRFTLGGIGGRFERNCASYRSPDDAQRDFLARGGPDRDARGLDPDGDGFACGWDPAPFRAAVGR